MKREKRKEKSRGGPPCPPVVTFHDAKRPRGLALVALVLLMTFALIAIISVSTFVVEHSRLTAIDEEWASGIYAAQAGIHAAILMYRTNDQTGSGFVTLGQYNMNAAHHFVLGGDEADLLMTDPSAAWIATSGVNRTLQGINLQNATDSQSLTIDRVIVTWGGNARLRRIQINNNNVWNGNASSPADADINDYTIAQGNVSQLPLELRFQQNPTGTITAEFVMIDGSSRTVNLYPPSNVFNFVIKSTGREDGAPVYRTVEAEYNAITGRVVDEREITAEITP